jgi:hypothetical protein
MALRQLRVAVERPLSAAPALPRAVDAKRRCQPRIATSTWRGEDAVDPASIQPIAIDADAEADRPVARLAQEASRMRSFATYSCRSFRISSTLRTNVRAQAFGLEEQEDGG